MRENAEVGNAEVADNRIRPRGAAGEAKLEFRVKRMLTIALLVDSGRSYGRGVLSGAARYVHAHGHLHIVHQDWKLNEGLPAWLMNRRCDGIIAYIETPEMLRDLRRIRVPLVDVCGTHHWPGIPGVGMNNRRSSEMAVEHLLGCGLRHVGFCGYADIADCMQRRAYFVETLGRRGIKPLIYEDRVKQGAGAQRSESETLLDERKLGRWLAALPKPAGLVACNDLCGRQVLNACLSRAIAVPDEVAVIGVGNDEVLCEWVDPPLSSIEPASERIGYEAAALLDAMMGKPRGLPVRTDKLNGVEIEPKGVVMRRSSDVLAVKDPIVSAAIRFIRQRADKAIRIEDVLDHLAAVDIIISRSTLNRRFIEFLGHSTNTYIMQVRIERARQLLTDTDYPLASVAGMIGIEHPEYFTVMFKRMTGKTPAAYRQMFGKP